MLGLEVSTPDENRPPSEYEWETAHRMLHLCCVPRGYYLSKTGPCPQEMGRLEEECGDENAIVDMSTEPGQEIKHLWEYENRFMEELASGVACVG